jgi:hypothetical protein
MIPKTLSGVLRALALRRLVAALVIAVIAASAGPAFAAGGQTGNLTGTVVDAVSKTPLAGAAISAVSPTGAYSARTDARGFFSILGLSIDTYTVSIEAKGYEPISISGVTVQGDQNLSLGTLSARKELQTIGRVTARSASSVFQPSQTIDSYTISGDRVTQTTGKTDATNENNLLLAIPGVTLSNLGNPTIRGGLRTEVGYQLDGVDFTEPFFSGNASNGRYNGLGSVQVVEGAGDATQGNVGGGVINIVPARGTYPATGTVDTEIGGPNFSHQFGFSYGFATPNGRISNYFSYIGQRDNPYLSGSRLDAASYNNFYGPSYEINNDLLDNFVLKFGKNNRQSLQVLYENRQFDQYGNYGGINGASYYLNDFANPFSETGILPIPGYANLIGLTPGLPTNPLAAPTQGEQIAWNPTRFLKFEYDSSIGAGTFVQAKYYNFETLQGNQNLTGSTGNTPLSLGLGSYPTWSETGGPRVGAELALTQQLGSRSTTTLDAKYEVNHPIWNEYDPNAIAFLLSLAGTPGDGPSINDFLSPATCAAANIGGPCGYLAPYFPNGIPRIPVSGINYNGADFHVFGIGLREQYAASEKLKLDLGIRFDQQIQQYGFNPLNPTEPNNPSDVAPSAVSDTYLKPHELEPRAAASYQFGPNDAVRASYGRSVVFLTGQTAGTPAGFYNYAPFLNVPAVPQTNFTCGSGYNTKPLPCQNYAQQLYWLYDQNFDAPDLGGALPAIYSNYDFTYSHQFKNGLAFKVTPFYKLGVNLPSFALVNSLAAGSAVFTVNNQGINRTTGVEAGLSTPDRRVGFSGFVTATYQNVLGSTPPLIGGEDALPINASGSLSLGDVYRAGYVSPFSMRIGGEYKTKSGFRFNPVVQYDRGYPFNIGNTIASTCQIGGAFRNIPQVNIASGCGFYGGPGITAIPGFQNNTGASTSTNYYDPAYSGNSLNPNIAATRGTPETPSAGGALSHPNVRADFTAEYTHDRSTIGFQVQNIFGNVYNGTVPVINPYFQPVATGLSGPQTGVNPNATAYPNRGFANVPKDAYAYTNGAYLLIPGAPTTYTLYYQLKL